MKEQPLYKFTGQDGDFTVENPERVKSLYFPLANDNGLLSAITPSLGGDIKIDQHTFLTPPVVLEDLHGSRTSRNFWISVKGSKIPWAVNGQTPKQRGDDKSETVKLEAGLLWQTVKRTNPKAGLEASVLNFVPSEGGAFEVMLVEVKNISKKKITLTGTSAIPLFARSADNLRDHRHVTSLLHRIRREAYGLSLKPTMTFNERGHLTNETVYYVVGVDRDGKGPVGVYPTMSSFIGDGGDLEKPESLFHNRPATDDVTAADQGKESLGGLQFKPVDLAPGKSTHYILFLGIDLYDETFDQTIKNYGNLKKIKELLRLTKEYWQEKTNLIQFKTGDEDFNKWSKWVMIQPVLRKIYGNSFLPDFDYGRGGRGWRDLWQDCLALLLANPTEVREMILNNFSGVRFDGSNATIIGRKPVRKKGSSGMAWVPEFKADRNNITRTWMDHGVWPYITTELYIHQTGDWGILLEESSYFRDAQRHRAKKKDLDWIRESEANPRHDNICKLLRRDGQDATGTILEHILVQTLVQFFNVGEHNLIRLEDADWNDGLDMASERGESVAFSCQYAGNLASLADLIEMAAEKNGFTEFTVAEELITLLDRVGTKIDYESIEEKTSRLNEYFTLSEKFVSGQKASIPTTTLVHDLREKAAWLKNKINETEWVEGDGLKWFNGYYDNLGKKVEGRRAHDHLQMTLTGQVYPILAGVASPERIQDVIRAVNEILWDHELGAIRLNSDFGEIQPNLGRAFSFVYGEKENGAVFSHMVVMYAYALYLRGFVDEGYRAINSLYLLAKNSNRSRIFPGIPEYFNNEGRGRYHFLTGSASWYIFTILAQVFGVKGRGGDLVLEPKLAVDQLDKSGEASVDFSFAGARVNVTYKNPSKLPFDQCHIKRIKNKSQEIPFSRLTPAACLIQREIIEQRKEWTFDVELKARPK